MNRRIILLGVVLGIQLGLAMILGVTTGGVSGVASSEPLLSFDTKAVTRVTIEQPKKAALVLERQGDVWSIPALDGFPAFTSKVESFVDRLSALYKRLPIVTSSTAVERFKVGQENYEHKVVISAGGKALGTLWLGGSPGFRQMYGRANEEEAVYNLNVAAYEVDADPNQWADKTVLSLKPEEITEITLADTHLVRVKATKQEAPQDTKAQGKKGKNDQQAQKETKGSGHQVNEQPSQWQMDGLAAGEKINLAAVDALVGQIANLSFDQVLGKENKPEYRQNAPVFKISVITQAGTHRDYVFSTELSATPPPAPSKNEQAASAPNAPNADTGKEYILKVSSSPYYFKIADFTAKELLETQRSKLVTPPKEAGKPATPAPSGASAPVAPVVGGTPSAPAAAPVAGTPVPTPTTAPHADVQSMQSTGGQPPKGQPANTPAQTPTPPTPSH